MASLKLTIEQETFVRASLGKMKVKDIAAHVDRKPSYIYSFAFANDLSTATIRKHWTKEEDRVLRKGRAAGRSYEDIAKEINREVLTVHRRAYYLRKKYAIIID